MLFAFPSFFLFFFRCHFLSFSLESLLSDQFSSLVHAALIFDWKGQNYVQWFGSRTLLLDQHHRWLDVL